MMHVESIQNVVQKVVSLWWLICPLWIVAASICFSARRKPSTTPLWAFMATSVVCLYVMVAFMVLKSARLGNNPDNGWVGMGTFYLLLFVSPELLAGAILLMAVPWRPAWNSRVVVPCVGASLLSVAACVAAAWFVPDPNALPLNVEIVVPDGFRGLIVIRVDKDLGVPPERTWKRTRYVIPASGELLATDEGPLITPHQDYARYASGAELPELGDSRSSGVGFTTLGSAPGKLLMWVGTRRELDRYLQTNNPWSGERPRR